MRTWRHIKENETASLYNKGKVGGRETSRGDVLSFPCY